MAEPSVSVIRPQIKQHLMVTVITTKKHLDSRPDAFTILVIPQIQWVLKFPPLWHMEHPLQLLVSLA